MNTIQSKLFLLAVISLSGCASTGNKTQDTLAQDLGLASTAFEYGQIDSAKSKYQTILQQYPENVEAILMIARIDLLQDRHHSATRALEALVSTSATNADQAALLLGRHALDMNKPNEAIEWFEQGLAVSQDQAALRNGLGVALDTLGQNKLARKEFIAALEMNPDSKTYRTNLALNYLFSGKAERAKSTMAPLMSMNDVPVYVQRNYALILIALGQEQQAFELLSMTMDGVDAEHDIELLKQRLQNETIL